MMKGRLDKGGSLEILRGEEWKTQACPFSCDDLCGDWCPLFGEPHGVEQQSVVICRKTLIFNEFEDRRPRKSKEQTT